MSLSVMQSLESFNSQRDGILLMDGDKVAALKEGFNSQRDGILQYFDRSLLSLN